MFQSAQLLRSSRNAMWHARKHFVTGKKNAVKTKDIFFIICIYTFRMYIIMHCIICILFTVVNQAELNQRITTLEP